MNLFYTVRVNLDTAHVYADVVKGAARAQKRLDQTVLTDSNYFCPVKTGTLQRSAIINSRIGSGEIVWQTPYAHRLYYYYVRPFYQRNPNACAKWFEAAKARFMKNWEKVTSGAF